MWEYRLFHARQRSASCLNAVKVSLRKLTSEVAVHAGFELKCRAARNDTPHVLLLLLSTHVLVVFCVFEDLDLVLPLGTLEEPVDVQARQVHLLGLDLADLDNLLGLDNGAVAGLAHQRVEVLARALEDAVAHLVGLCRLDPSEVGVRERLLQEVVFAVEVPHLALVVVGCHAAVGVEFLGELALGVQGVKTGDAVEGWQTDAGTSDLFSELLCAQVVS